MADPATFGALSIAVKSEDDGDKPKGIPRTKTFGNLGLTICFKDLEYHVPSRTDKKDRAYLLKKVSGFFAPFQMSALMGPSGSGKTTLLDVLAGRKTAGKIEGTISFSGQKPTSSFLRRYTGYVEQFDTLLPILTVEEMLMYTAELKRSISESKEDKQAVVEWTIQKLALETCRHVPIGSALTKGISGGQAKRTNIGIALVTNPRVLFLDEPTSGLDSYTSNEVMTVVKQLVKEGVTICATIHSPTAYCFNLFDRLIMLVKGRVVYFGERATAVSYTRGACPMLKDSSSYNDAEWLVDLVTEADRTGNGDRLADTYAESDLCKANIVEVNERLESKQDVPEHVQKELAVKKAISVPSWWAVWVLFKYRTLRNYSSPDFIGARLGDKIIFTFLLCTLYLNVGRSKDLDKNFDVAAILFMSCVMPGFAAAAYVPTIVLDRALFYREKSDGLYRTSTYLIHKLLDEILLVLPLSVLVAAAMFYAIGFQGEFVLYWLVYLTTLGIGIVLAYAVASASPNMDVANAALPTYVVVNLFFAGFLMRMDTFPVYWKWYTYLDFLRFGWGALMKNTFENETRPFLGNKTILQLYDLEDVDKWAHLGYLSLFFAALTVLAWAAMNYIKHQSR